MLTNNKKRSFVKLIALTLAALMVFSVCLTGCTDEDARLAAEAAKDAADKAQSSADAAQTAADGKTTTEAVAAQIAEALKPYLKADAALSEADVDKKVADLKAAIEASLKNYQAKGDYATKADVDKKQDKGDYATNAALKSELEKALKNYQAKGDYATNAGLKSELEKALKNYQAKGDYATPASVAAAIAEALKGYATGDDVDAAVNTALEVYATKADVAAALESFAAFAKSEDLEALSKALSEAMGATLTEEAVAEIAKNVMADYEIDAKIAAAVAAQDEITMANVTTLVNETLAKYLTAEEIDARFAKAEQDLKDQVALLEQALADAKAELETLNGATAEAAAADLKAAVEALEKKLADAKADLEAADAAADAAAAADLEATVEALKKELADAKAELETKIGETDAKVDELAKQVADLEKFFAGYDGDPTKIGALLNTLESQAMDKDEWQAATWLVVETLQAASDLVQHVVGKHYTQAAKQKINDYMSNIEGLSFKIEIFKPVSAKKANGTTVFGTYLDDAHTEDLHATGASIDTRVATSKILSELTVVILRAANTKQITAIKTAIDNAKNVNDFTKDMAAWRKALYEIGDEYVVLKAKADGSAYENDSWTTDAEKTYHNSAVFKKATKYAQVAHYTDESAYKTAVAKLEEMYITYLFEAMAFDTAELGTADKAYASSVVALWKKVDGNTTTYKWTVAGTKSDEYVLHADGSKFYTQTVTLNGTDPAAMGDGFVFQGYFAGIDESKIPAAAKSVATYSVYTAAKNANWVATIAPAGTQFGHVMAGHSNNSFLEPTIKVDLAIEYTNDAYVKQATLVRALLDKHTPAKGQAKLSATYQALAQMIEDAKTANSVASDRFAGRPQAAKADNNTIHADPNAHENRNFFLWHIAHNHSADHKDNNNNYMCNCSLKSDDDYIKALTAYMVEQTESEPFEPVPSSWTEPVWLTPVCDLDGSLAQKAKTPDTYASADANTTKQAKTIDVYFDYALNINGYTSVPDTYAPIARFPLYEKLHRRAWEVLYAKYASYANQVLNTMVNDFRVVAKSATLGGVALTDGADNGFLTSNTSAATALRLYVDTTGSNNPLATDVTSYWTPEFIDAYYNGRAANNQWSWSVGTASGFKKQIGPTYVIDSLKQYYAHNNAPVKYPTGVAADGTTINYDTVTSDVVTAIAQAQATLDTMLVASSVGPRKQIIEASAKYANGITDEDWAVLKGRRVQDAFDDILGGAMDNLEEIMYRFMYTEINDAFINLAYNAITADVNNTIDGNHKYTGGVANFFANEDNPQTADLTVVQSNASVLKKMMELYVSANVTAADAGDKQGYKINSSQISDTQTIYTLSVKPNVTFANDYMSVTVDTAVVYKNLKGNIITNAEQAQLGDVINKSATDAIANAKKLYANAVNTMANMAVKYRYHDYVQQAKDSAYFSYLAYVAVAGDYNQRLALDKEYNNAANLLTITEYYAQRGAYGDNEYIKYFVSNVLGVSIAATSPYYAMLGNSGSNYAAELGNIDVVAKAFKFDVVNGVKEYRADEFNFVIEDSFWTLTVKDTNGDGKFDAVDDTAAKADNTSWYYLNDAYVADGVAYGPNDKTNDCAADKYAGKVPTFAIPQSPLSGLLTANNYYSTGSATISYDAVVNAGK